MLVTIEDVFEGIQRPEYTDLYFDEPFNESIGTALHMGRMLLRLDRTPDKIVRHVCYEPNHDPDSPAKQAFGTSRASFREELVFDVRSGIGQWKTIPNMFSDRVTNTGTITFADDPVGTRRTVKCDVKVRLFGFGGRVEKLIVREIENSYAASAKLTREWIAKR